MSLEIERKFRIKMPEKDRLRSREAVTVTGLVQCYLTAHEGWERRVRQATDALTGEVRCTLTEKTEEAGLIRTELEKEISPSEYEALLGEMLPGTPPLYKVIPSRGQEQYLYDDKALEKYRKTHKAPFTLQRYKGLGEMDAEQLWETTLNPETRMMQRVEIEDARLASNVTRMLMGTEVPPRKEFIHEHARDALLDV